MTTDRITIGIYLAGRTYHDIQLEYGDFEDWFSRELNKHNAETIVFDVRENEYAEPDSVDGIVITGSSSSVCTDPAEWVSPLLEILSQLMQQDLPMLGVCFGHQAMAAAAGGTVKKHPVRRELGTTQLHLTAAGTQSPLFQGIESTFYAQETHEDVVTWLPGGNRVLAKNEHNAYQSIQFGETAYSTQFHPEISAAVMREYIQVYKDRLQHQIQEKSAEYDVISSRVDDTSTGTILLKNFTEIVRSHRVGTR